MCGMPPNFSSSFAYASLPERLDSVMQLCSSSSNDSPSRHSKMEGTIPQSNNASRLSGSMAMLVTVRMVWFFTTASLQLSWRRSMGRTPWSTRACVRLSWKLMCAKMTAELFTIDSDCGRRCEQRAILRRPCASTTASWISCRWVMFWSRRMAMLQSSSEANSKAPTRRGTTRCSRISEKFVSEQERLVSSMTALARMSCVEFSRRGAANSTPPLRPICSWNSSVRARFERANAAWAETTSSSWRLRRLTRGATMLVESSCGCCSVRAAMLTRHCSE
mmetsp:Transcript_4627/g.16287  ORF Transcript_4627/g.16287 Transcript_4627/m.16287 type:complete len:277 (-) Transcript_4627:504-1334(-)